jgi:hypothetical protein
LATPDETIINTTSSGIGRTMFEVLSEPNVPCVVIGHDKDRIAECRRLWLPGHNSVTRPTNKFRHAAGLERIRGIICATNSAVEYFYHSDGS